MMMTMMMTNVEMRRVTGTTRIIEQIAIERKLNVDNGRTADERLIKNVVF